MLSSLIAKITKRTSLSTHFNKNHVAPALCTECVGHYDTPQCVEVCPVECIIVDVEHPESREQLLAKYATLVQEKSA